MNFGYLLIVSSNKNADYLKMAYALALNIKITQKSGYDKIALVIDDVDVVNRCKSKWVFDHIVEWNKETFWNGRSWMDQLTPFENTVCLDVDMLFFRDTSHWIDYFIENAEIYLPNISYTYREEKSEDDFYRRTFRENNLPNLYSFYTFFKKNSNTTKEFFTLSRYITKYPDEFSNIFLSKHKPKIIGTDEALALSSHILGIDKEISYTLNFPKVVHMKPMIQNWPWPAESWSDHVGFYFNRKSKLKIANYSQLDLIHYVEKDCITDEYISILENLIWKKNT
jgi:hypothetical protein